LLIIFILAVTIKYPSWMLWRNKQEEAWKKGGHWVCCIKGRQVTSSCYSCLERLYWLFGVLLWGKKQKESKSNSFRSQSVFA